VLFKQPNYLLLSYTSLFDIFTADNPHFRGQAKDHRTVPQNNNFNAAGHDLSSISGRINALLDLSGHRYIQGSLLLTAYSPVNEGRSKELASEYGFSKSGAHNWVACNKLPTRPHLKKLVAGCLAKIEQGHSIGAVAAWIEHGIAVPCPFLQQDL